MVGAHNDMTGWTNEDEKCGRSAGDGCHGGRRSAAGQRSRRFRRLHVQAVLELLKLQKDYPRGIAHTKYRVSKNSKYVYSRINGKKVKYRPSLISDKAYTTQSLVRDRDRDKVACELSGW